MTLLPTDNTISKNGATPSVKTVQWPIACKGGKSALQSGSGYFHTMTAIEQIHQLPIQEKLLIMEAIWEDISREEDGLEVPQWHKDILDERERLIAQSKARFIDWEDAKKQIGQAIR